MSNEAYSADEIMIVTAARLLADDDVVFIGIGLPSKAASLARLTHAPNISLIYESGPLSTAPEVLPLSIGDGELSRTARAVVSVPEMFAYWLQGGRIKTGFLGAAQIDKYANLNSTVIGNYRTPKVRLPGAGGAPEIASFCARTLVMLKQTRQSFVEKVDFVTTVGFSTGGTARAQLRVPGLGPVAVITDLGVLEPDPESHELILTKVHPGISPDAVVSATGWPLTVSNALGVTELPTVLELQVLRGLRTAMDRPLERASHAQAAAVKTARGPMVEAIPEE
jgi:glutaconate CoA-transferase subunit B